MNKDTLLATFNETFDDLGSTISLFDKQSFNQIPFEGSWTPGQVIQHLILANGNFAQVLQSEVGETDRPIDAKVATLKDVFLNFETKFISPEFIKPRLENYDYVQHTSAIKNIKKDIASLMPTLDLSKTCLSFELPHIGHLTRLEAIYFVIFHTSRHLNQLKNIYKHLKLS